MDPLNRHRAPFPEQVWDAIDATAAGTASALLSARRVLDLEGPFGLGLTTVEAGSEDMHERLGKEPEAAVAILGASLSVPVLWRPFGLSLRRVAAHLEHGQPLDLAAVEDAAEAMARLEERLVYYGDDRVGLAGLLNAPGALTVGAGDWSDIDQALRDVLDAVTALDDQGYRGPYGMVAAPRLFNALFRRYPDSDMLQVEHLSRLCQLGIHKADIRGAAVFDPRVGKLVLGQDLMAGFAWSDGVQVRLFLSESIVFKLDDARAVCVLPTTGQPQD